MTSRHQIDGEYMHDGVVYCSVFPREIVESLPQFAYKPDDIIIATYPKSGTTWMQQLVCSIVKREDLVDPRDGRLCFSHLPFLESRLPGRRPDVEVLKTTPSPRIIKTHMSQRFFQDALKQKVKIVVVLRNVKDVLVSYYHFYKHIPKFGFTGDFDEFFELFREKHLCHGDWFDWVLDWWKEHNNTNVLFVTYEDMHGNMHREARRVCEFLGKDLSEDDLSKIVDDVSFGSMKKRFQSEGTYVQDSLGILRKGVVGNWSGYLSPQQLQYIDALVEQRVLPAGLPYKETL